MFVGREAELKFLNQYYDTEGSQILVVYGQSGVGKTALLNFFTKDKAYSYYLARPCAARDQRYQWAAELAYAGFQLPDYPDYKRLFECMADTQKNAKQVIILDEFHSFVKGDSAFMQELITYVGNRDPVKPVMVILATSASGWVENSMIGKIGSAALSINGLLKLRELKFQEMRKIFPGYGLDDGIGAYAVLGGIPGRWNNFDEGLTIRENIIRNILRKESRLREELSAYMWSELREPAVYNTLLAAMARGCNKLNDLYKHTEFSRAKISVYLKNLMELELVEKVFSYETEGYADAQKGIYRVSSPYARFYFRFLFPKQSMLETLSGEEFFEREIRECFPCFVEEAYRNICRERYEEGFASVGEWLGKSGSLDIVACAENGELAVASCSYAKEMKAADYERLLLCMKKARISADYVHLYSEKGFDKILQKKADKGELVLFCMDKDIN